VARRRADLNASLTQGIAVWVGWILFGITLLNTLALAFSGWAVNARALGVRVGGRGLFYAGSYAATMATSVNLALFSAALAAGAWLISGRAALWLVAAALMSGLSVGLLMVFGQ
jgi:hypothetical protein